MILLGAIFDSLAKGTSCYYFSHGASLYIANHSAELFLHLFHTFF